MRDAYKHEADVVAKKHGLTHELIDELKIRNLTVRQFHWIDPVFPDSPDNQGVELIDRNGKVVATQISDHVGRAAIAALDEILTRERYP